jgi:APA family basic amino acid/polyamine antiporter
MLFKRLFATKSLEQLHHEMAQDEGRLRRVLGPVSLTSLGIGAIIGAGIFVMTGRVAAEDAGPAIMLSYAFAGLGCALAAFCYAEFAALAPVAGSAYTYAYATLGELLAWIIGWDLVLEYAMSCATVASAWSEYFNYFLETCFDFKLPDKILNDPFSKAGAFLNLPAVAIMVLVTIVLVIGIRESAASNTFLVIIKLGVVVFVIAMGIGYVSSRNWTEITPQERKTAEETSLSEAIGTYVKETEKRKGDDANTRIEELEPKVYAVYMVRRVAEIRSALDKEGKLTEEAIKRLNARELKALQGLHTDKGKKPKDRAELLPLLPQAGSTDAKAIDAILGLAKEEAKKKAVEKWGLLGELGLNDKLAPLDESTRSNFTPYGLSGIMLGAALVFFAFIGFDSISTHAEEAVRPQRDVPIGILTSLFICTALYMAVSAIITGMLPYPDIDTKAAVAKAFGDRAELEGSPTLKAAGVLIAIGGLAGMTSVLLITFLSQARIFLAMARDGFLPKGIFGTVHPKFKTPHISTMVTGAVITAVAAFTPIGDLEKMVNIGTLFAFVVVCAAVLILRIKRPDAKRPFRCPGLFLVAPLGILVNVTMMLFLPLITWLRLVVWLGIGLLIYFSYGYFHSSLGKQMNNPTPGATY